jgi:hypothetical protein
MRTGSRRSSDAGTHVRLPLIAIAGPNAGGVLLVHCNPALTVPGEATFVDGGLAACDRAVVQAPADSTVLWFLYAAFPLNSSPSVSVVSFGCQFDADSVGILWSAAPPGSAALRYEPEAGNGVYWPYPGTGELLGFANPLTGTLNEIYVFAGYGPTGETFSVVANPDSVQGGRFADDGTPSELDEIADYGSLGFGAAGYAPCPIQDSPGGPNAPNQAGGAVPETPETPGEPEGGDPDQPLVFDDCAPNVVVIRFAANVISFPENPEAHEHFTQPLSAAEFVRSDLDSVLSDVGVQTFETVAPQWRHMTDEDMVDIHGRRVDLVDFTDVYRVTLSGAKTLDSVISELSERSGIQHVECDRIGSLFMEDSLWTQQWPFLNLGQDDCTWGYDMNALEAWTLQDSAGTKIGISDTRLNPSPAGIAGYIDTRLSWCFVDNNCDWSTNEPGRHATMVASVAANGTRDQAPLVSIPNLPSNHGDSLIVSLRVDGQASFGIAALAYVTLPPVRGRIRVVNHSWGIETCLGRNDYDTEFRGAFRNAFLSDINLVCASGNDPRVYPCPEDTTIVFPAAFTDYALAVSSVDCRGRARHQEGSAPAFMHGSYIDMAAPGKGIWVLDADGPHLKQDWAGTSFSAPYVSGAISLLLGADPDLTNEDCNQLLKLTASPTTETKPIWAGAGMLNVFGAIQCVTAGRHVVHDSTGAFTVALDETSRVVRLRNVPPYETADAVAGAPYLVDRYRLTWTLDHEMNVCDTCLVDYIWPRGKTSTGWRKIDESIGDYYDGEFYANHADVAWESGTDPVFYSYVYKVRDMETGDSLGWAPFDPYNSPPTGSQVTFSYVVNTMGVSAVAQAEGQEGSFRVHPHGGWWSFDLPSHVTAPLSVEIYNVAGQRLYLVRVETDQDLSRGIRWDERDSRGRRVASGLYFARLRSGRGASGPNNVVRLLIVR